MSPKKARQRALKSITIEGRTDGCGPIYSTITIADGRCFELFTGFGKAGGCARATAQAISELVSRALRSEMDVHDAIVALSGHQCHMGPHSCMARMAQALKAVEFHLQSGVDIEAAIEQIEEEGRAHHA